MHLWLCYGFLLMQPFKFKFDKEFLPSSLLGDQLILSLERGVSYVIYDHSKYTIQQITCYYNQWINESSPTCECSATTLPHWASYFQMPFDALIRPRPLLRPQLMHLCGLQRGYPSLANIVLTWSKSSFSTSQKSFWYSMPQSQLVSFFNKLVREATILE